MKKFIIAFVFLLAACSAPATPTIPWTSTAAPTSAPPTTVPIFPMLTNTPAATPTPTQAFVNLRVSPVDGMPQVYIPAGTFRMGGMDVRRAPNETPEHDVTISAFWMDQLEVTT